MKNQKWINFYKKCLRFSKYFVVSSIILVLIQIAVGYWLISSRWSIFLTDAQMVSLARDVNTTPSLPDNFIEMYERLYPNAVHTSMTKQLFVNYGTRIVFRRRQIENLPHCACDLVYDIQVKNNQLLADVHWPGRLQELEYGFAVEDFSTPEKCFDYVMQNRISGLRATAGLEFEELLSKNVANMRDDELFELIMLVKEKDFNRYKNPKKFEEEFEKLKNKIEQ